MKINDFRIGNFIKYVNYENGGGVIRVSLDEFENIQDPAIMNENGNSYFQIPIDIEWLNLFGFIKDADDIYRLNKSNLIEVLINDSGVKVYTQSVFLNHIVYVHQLQNLYQSLRGIELKTDENK